MTRNLIILGCMWVTAASLALAQDAPPAPPAPPAMPAPAPLSAALPDPPDPPMPAPAAQSETPAAKAAKADKADKAPKAAKGFVVDNGQVYNLDDWGQYVDLSQMKIDAKEIAEQAKAAAKMSIDAGQLGQEIRDAVKAGQWDNVNDLASQITEKALAAQKGFSYQDLGKLYAQATPMPPQQPLFGQQGRGAGRGGVDGGVIFGPAGRINLPRGPNSEDRLFSSGETNLDNHNLDNALVNFNEVISRGGPRADGALYYKAFTLNKMGRRDEAQAAINELRKSYSGSKWLEDAKALEADVKAGKSSSDEDDIKVMAINGLMQSDPEKAFPILEGLIKGAHIPRLKRESVMVLAQNSSPRAQALLEQIARGTVGDPDQQVGALRYVVDTKSNPARAQLLMDVYSGASNDASVRSVVIRSFVNSKDFDHLGQIVKSEKNIDLRDSAIRSLGDEDGQPKLWALYSAETTPEAKRHILSFMYQNGNIDKLAEIARTEKDPSVRKEAIRALGSIKGTNVTTSMIAIYGGESDSSVKKEIVNDMAGNKDAKSMIEMYRKEKDVDMRRYIMGRIINIHSPEVNDFLLEILK